MPFSKIKRGTASEDGTKFEVLLPEFGFHNIFNPGFGSIGLLSNLFTLTAYVATKTPDYFSHAVREYGHNLFIIQTITKIKPEFYSIIEPFTIWPLVKGTIKLESFFRFSALQNFELISLDSDIVLAEGSSKMININMETRRATLFHPQIVKKFEKNYKEPNVIFPDISHYLKMDLNSSESHFESLMNNKHLEVFKMEKVLFENDEDFNGHITYGIYERLSANCLSRAICLNEVFKETYGKHGNRMRISQLSSNFLKECKAQDTLTVLCIHDKTLPAVLDFKLFRKESTGMHQLVCITQLTMHGNSSKM